MIITVQYVAILKQQCGLSEETLETRAQTPRDLYRELCHQYRFTLLPESLRVSINDRFTEWDRRLRPNDRIVFIPPVSGG